MRERAILLFVVVVAGGGCGILNGLDPAFRSPLVVGGPVPVVADGGTAPACDPAGNPLNECIPDGLLCADDGSACVPPDDITSDCPESASLAAAASPPNAPIIYTASGFTNVQLQIVDLDGDLTDPATPGDFLFSDLANTLTVSNVVTSFNENGSLPAGNQEGFVSFDLSNVDPFSVQIVDGAGHKSNRFCYTP